MKTDLSRRSFLASTLAAGAAPMFFGGCATKFLANSKINIGIIGCGRIATSFEMPCVLKRPDLARIVAVCDLDSKRADNAKAMVDRKYADGARCAVYHDYRQLCARTDIDAVMICLPDFWHALVATTAICSGKAVWLQKPFTQTITEGRLLANLAKKYNTVMQVGSQQRSWNTFQAGCGAVLAGRIGRVKRIEVGLGIDKSGGCCKPEPVPSNFDYETWLGPTDHSVPYNWTRCHNDDLAHVGDRPGWIQLAPYGWGMITNWGAHHLDVVRWGLGGADPEKVEGTCGWMDLSGDRLWNVHTTYDLHYTFNGGKTDCHLCDKYQNGVKFVGENGDWIFCSRSYERITPSDPNPPALRPGEYRPLDASSAAVLPPLEKAKNYATQLHVDNWLEAVLANDPAKTVTNAEGGHRSTSLCSLGQMCMDLGRGRKDGFSLKWDAKRERTGNAAADALMKPFANGRFDLRVNLAEFDLDMDQVLRGRA